MHSVPRLEMGARLSSESMVHSSSNRTHNDPLDIWHTHSIQDVERYLKSRPRAAFINSRRTHGDTNQSTPDGDAGGGNPPFTPEDEGVGSIAPLKLVLVTR